MIPFWTSFLVRTYAWMFLLRDTGLINSALRSVGIIREPCRSCITTAPSYRSDLQVSSVRCSAALCDIGTAGQEPARGLGRSRAQAMETITRVVIPLCAPGFRAGAVLVFIPCLGAYLTPDLLGGGKTVMAGNLIQNQFTTARDWPFGSAVSLS